MLIHERKLPILYYLLDNLTLGKDLLLCARDLISSSISWRMAFWIKITCHEDVNVLAHQAKKSKKKPLLPLINMWHIPLRSSPTQGWWWLFIQLPIISIELMRENIPVGCMHVSDLFLILISLMASKIYWQKQLPLLTHWRDTSVRASWYPKLLFLPPSTK